MNKQLLTFALLAFLNFPAYAGDIVVIVNPANSTQELSKRDLINLYMGKHHSFQNGDSVVAFDQKQDSEIREQFYRSLVNKSVAQVNAYWARLLFTGRVTPPKELADSQEVLDQVKNNPNAIGYIDSDYLENSVKEVFRMAQTIN